MVIIKIRFAACVSIFFWKLQKITYSYFENKMILPYRFITIKSRNLWIQTFILMKRKNHFVKIWLYLLFVAFVEAFYVRNVQKLSLFISKFFSLTSNESLKKCTTIKNFGLLSCKQIHLNSNVFQVHLFHKKNSHSIFYLVFLKHCLKPYILDIAFYRN